MLYFRFNTDNFIAPQQTLLVTPYENGKPASEPYETIESIDIGTISQFFFTKLFKELNLNIRTGFALAGLFGIPFDAFSIDEEIIESSDSILKFTLNEYAKLPIPQLDNKSLQDLGIKIEFCKRIANDKLNMQSSHYMQQNDLSYVTEEVLWKNMNNEQKANKLSSYFNKISTEGKELLIVDPYILKDDSDDYCDLLTAVIKKSKADSIIIITEKRNYKNSCYNKISSKINTKIKVVYSKDFHDRFWISDRKKGIYTGTSLNGIGKKISLINYIPDNDVTEIIDALKNKSLI